MDELTLLCAQELMEEMMDTASSSDEEDEREQKMNVLTLLCAQNLIDDLIDSSSSSDEDDEIFTLLCYSQLLERSENLSKCEKKVSTKNQEKSFKENPLANEVKVSPFGNDDSNTSTMFQEKEIATILATHNVEANVDILENNVSKPLSSCNLKRKFQSEQEMTSLEEDRKKDSMLSLNNVQESPFDEKIIDSLSEGEFKKFFKISRESVTFITDKFSFWYCKDSNEHKNEKSNIKTTVYSFLWFCANAVSFESVARMFNASLMETKQSFNIILDFFEQELASEIIKLPRSYMEKEAIAKDFEKIDGFPNVLGCLAESCISLKIPKLAKMCGGSQLYLRGVCDSNMKFLNIKIRFSNDSNDDIFFEKDLPKLCFPKYQLLGDIKCPIRDHLVIPYKNSENLSEPEKYFNTKLYRTHVKIKTAFDVLKKRFQQFSYLDFNNIENLSKFIMACCILHNVCIERQDFYDDDETNKNESYSQFGKSVSSAKSDDFLTDLGIMKRHELTQVFFREKK